MTALGLPPPSSDELQLRQLLALPSEKRAAVSAKFAGLVWRLLTPHESYVQRLASRWVRAHEIEDVAADVILKAAEHLKEQFIPSSNRLRSKKRDWNPETTRFATWFRNFCGYPFKKKSSGAITNVIRKVWQTCRDASYDPIQDFNRADDNMLDSEQQFIKAEDARTEKLRLQRLQPELKTMDRDDPRTSFMLRLSYGAHDFHHLDTETLVLLAKELRLPRVQVALVREIAKDFDFEPGQKTLSNEQIGSLTGVSEGGVRYQLSRAKKNLRTAIVARLPIRNRITKRPRT
ncbi:hypothetical protein [Bradyrhizobium diazoefficiens]|uniref:hypothetical protein n=1 Tax=Bradyrhizobium diazoefficiens TaxID=1355477 RepID=UPI0027147A93|nr:hypothetical protein [Bradyrhizobium diazoefficiens]WLC16638.1 hypothetical protein QIH76_42390 [Bradyrhizobium diazoefficiens]